MNNQHCKRRCRDRILSLICGPGRYYINCLLWLVPLCLLFVYSAKVATNSSQNATSTPNAELFELERKQFRLARSALAEDNIEQFEQLASSITHYPLYRYLIFERLRKDFRADPGKNSVTQLNQFEKEFGDEALTRKLTYILQQSLFDDEQWKLFLGVSESRVATKMTCAKVRALHEVGELLQFDDDITEFWIASEDRPDVCAEALAGLEGRTAPGIIALWERIFTAMENNRFEIATELSAQLASRDRKQVRSWIEATDNPESLLHGGSLDDDTLLNRRIIIDLVWRWSKDSLADAITHWSSIKDQYSFYSDRRYELSRKIALRGAYRRLPEAQQWLNDFTARDDDLELKEWRVRAALLEQNWSAVLARIEELPEEEQEEDHWLYWVARAHEANGEQKAANAIYLDLAQLQSFHGFLSADRLGLPYSLYDEPIDVEQTLLEDMRMHPALIRAREYHHAGISWEARREWGDAIIEFDQEQILASIVLAESWAMYDRAIISAGKAKATRALRYRFPLLFEESVARAAAEMEIDPTIIYGVMRRESAFIPDIKSGAGAIGLMQLMPKTAEYVADLKGKKKWHGDLTNIDTNIDFGAFYLRHVLNRFDNHLPLALASYNAGPHRVKKWLPTNTDLPADVWIDTIPFTETRRYVRAVLAYSMIFEWRLKGKVTPLDSRLQVVAKVAPTQG